MRRSRVGLMATHAIAKRPEGSDITLSKKWLLRTQAVRKELLIQ